MNTNFREEFSIYLIKFIGLTPYSCSFGKFVVDLESATPRILGMLQNQFVVFRHSAGSSPDSKIRRISSRVYNLPMPTPGHSRAVNFQR